MAVISDYEEEEPMQQSRTSTPRQPPEPVKPPQEVQPEPPPQAVANPPVETPSPVAPAPAPAPQADTKFYQHDPVLSALLEEHKRQPLELLTTVIDFLFRETDLSRESRVEHRVTEIVTAAKRRRSAYDGEDVAPEKIAKVEDIKKEPKTTEPSTPIPEKSPKTPKAPKRETAETSNVTPSPLPVDEEPEIDSEGTGLSTSISSYTSFMNILSSCFVTS